MPAVPTSHPGLEHRFPRLAAASSHTETTRDRPGWKSALSAVGTAVMFVVVALLGLITSLAGAAAALLAALSIPVLLVLGVLALVLLIQVFGWVLSALGLALL